MRTLKFIVDGQTIKLDPGCDFSGLVPGSSGYLQAEFSFSQDWSGAVKIAGFYSVLGREFPPQILNDGKTCIIPAEALKKKTFKVQVVGKKNDTIIRTNKLAVSQNGV